MLQEYQAILNLDKSSNDKEEDNYKKLIHKTLDEVTKNLEEMAFNKAIANLYYFVGELSKGETKEKISKNTAKEALEFLLIMLSPFIPHLSEEGWSYLGKKGLVCEQNWPTVDKSAIEEKSAEIIIQINGKKRGVESMPLNLDEDSAIALALDNQKIKRDLDNHEVKKVIYVKGRIINFVV